LLTSSAKESEMKIGELFYMHFNADFFISYFVHTIVMYDMKIVFPVTLFLGIVG
jgi:hypothetical protein